jgi:glycosyltransferase involved in cell wall biosynthesis
MVEAQGQAGLRMQPDPNTMSRYRVLLVVHNHPELLVGGVEMYVKNLYDALCETREIEPILLARAGRPFTPTDAPHDDTPLALVNDDPNQYLLYTDFEDFKQLFGRLGRTKGSVARAFEQFLLAQRPDVVHFQHTAYLGYDMIRVARNALPDVPIVLTFQEYWPICHRAGQMVRTVKNELCLEESPRRCNECFPEIPTETFYMRKRFIQSQLALVDQFIAPSAFLLERYVDWGIPRERILNEDYGFRPVQSAPVEEDVAGTRFGFFGQMNPYKGVDVLLRAMELLGPDFEGTLTVHGANYDFAPEELRAELDRLLAATGATVTYAGPYENRDLPRLLEDVDWVIVPSIWWENSPLVISEAFMNGRPVICSDIGGMAEKVTDGVNGLHFMRGDHEHLAEVLDRAATTPELWEKLRAGIPGPNDMSDHVALLDGTYRRLMQERGASRVEAALEKVAGA